MTLEDQILAKAKEFAAATGYSEREALDALRAAMVGEIQPIRLVGTADGEVVDLNEETP